MEKSPDRVALEDDEMSVLSSLSLGGWERIRYF